MSESIGIVRDFREEGWPSMDLVADMLLQHWPNSCDTTPVDICPPYREIAAGLPVLGISRAARSFDRGWNRLQRLPAHLRSIRGQFNYFHIADHSYAHLVHELPALRTGVFCHDLDAFQCLLAPNAHPRSALFQRMTKRILSGLRQSALVFHSTIWMGERLQDQLGIPADRLRYVPYGVSSDFFIESSDMDATSIKLMRKPFLLHVGSCIPRKRIDVLLEVFAKLYQNFPDLELVKIGDPWTKSQKALLSSLKLQTSVVHRGKVNRRELLEAYRNAALTLVTSDAEGFGLPVIEALACGGAVVASDLPTLREAGGKHASYAPVADVNAWHEIAQKLLMQVTSESTRGDRRAWARRFSWQAHARAIADAYRTLPRTATA